jgi:hypothetical protein
MSHRKKTSRPDPGAVVRILSPKRNSAFRIELMECSVQVQSNSGLGATLGAAK